MGQALTNEAVSQVKWIDLKAKIDAVDVLFVFGVGDGSVYRSLSSWLKKEEQRYLVFIEEQEEVFLKAKEMPLAKDPKARLFYWKKGDEEIFQQISMSPFQKSSGKIAAPIAAPARSVMNAARPDAFFQNTPNRNTAVIGGAM